MVNGMHNIRKALIEIDPGSTAHQAQDEPGLSAIYPVRGHDHALSYDRALIIGNRGMGKSFWAAVLSHDQTRQRAAKLYPRARLNQLQVRLGSHEAAGKAMGDVAPSRKEIALLLRNGIEPETIWQGVVLRALSGIAGVPAYDSLSNAVNSIQRDILGYEQLLRNADSALQARGERFLILFDALDRLATEWSVIRNLTRELLRLALDLNGYRAIRAKVFMRSDQFGDEKLFEFQDSSKLKTGAVRLEWQRADLYGLLYSRIWNNESARGEFGRVVSRAVKLQLDSDEIPEPLREDEIIQAKVFSSIAGEFMGTDRRRGRTYSWLHQHLSDSFEQTSPRSFLIAARRAADHHPPPRVTAIDYNGIKDGVVAASQGRVDELKEDNIWISDALDDLAELEVPSEPSVFISRWRKSKTVAKIEAKLKLETDRPGPLAFENSGISQEEALLQSMIDLGIVEKRGEDRINMPDLFRVAARIKRRGGVKPPVRR